MCPTPKPRGEEYTPPPAVACTCASHGATAPTSPRPTLGRTRKEPAPANLGAAKTAAELGGAAAGASGEGGGPSAVVRGRPARPAACC
eukprot:scaffold266_cov391-Prasinococcus_capsulatus_cf.AAC.18